ncbi:hypothetical protein HYPBUDRAFT_154114 [Hyphopichia burtonii NRRL Y-1933]|jgi:small subunit ribosomal protein MRP21|uniref:Ribosomal protein S21 n=1 Tax=Hyphopichia burtonii NRRL Y-1933 TaxID=984485 RepID=A0A1E4RDL8_9ASCO|nr:hypothetical protein HYPBUDRAFT_154114 [Hyphopichia burtonii NRRL Y-1933]ODV65333.1 hypothetical protein HYPBUDRAFT_154114 [Hyphopichia burtonii NRRL Y-1933]
MFRSLYRGAVPARLVNNVSVRCYSDKGPVTDFSLLTKVIQNSNANSNDNSKKSHFGSSFQAPNNMSTVEHVDSLLGGSDQPAYHSISTRDTYLGSEVRHPREVAKDIRLRGPLAGRAVNVVGNNVLRASSQLKSLIRDNKIRQLHRSQLRFTTPAKFRKQKKREWWRTRFAEGFKDIMTQVQDARRRGY